MAPKKRSARAQPQSDYETDTAAAFTDTASAFIAPPPSRTNTELNLLVLRRYCPGVERIVQIAPFAVVYSFSPESQGWEKIGTEGTLFVCQLASPSYSRYSVIILNRKSLDNFIVELVSADNVEITDSYVILQSQGEDGVDQIYGLWIFSEDGVTPSTQQIVAMAIEECALRAEEGKKLAEESYEEVPNTYNGFEGNVYQVEAEAQGGYQTQSSVEAPQPTHPMPPGGQQIELMQLFGKAPTPAQQQMPQQAPQVAPEPPQQYYQQQQNQQPKFASNPDTDFFRSSASPALQAAAQPPLPPQAPAQQNLLLDMFNSARRG